MPNSAKIKCIGLPSTMAHGDVAYAFFVIIGAEFIYVCGNMIPTVKIFDTKMVVF